MTVLLRNVNVVDTETGQVQPSASVLLQDAKIRFVLPAGGSLPAAEKVIDGEGLFVVPGYLDMHAHVLDDEDRDNSLLLMLAHGITGWRQMSGSPEHLAARQQGALDFGPGAPEMLAMPGQILTYANAATPEAAVEEVRRQKQQGADFIKTIFVSPATFFAAQGEATRIGLPYAGHLSPGVDAVAAAKAGMRSIEHLGPADLELISCSKREFLIRLILKLKPPKPMGISAATSDTAGRIAIANPNLQRLNMDPDAFSKTQGLMDSFSESKAKRLAETCAAHGTWQVPTLIRLATMQFGYEVRYREHPELLRYVPKAKRDFWESVAAQYQAKLKPGAAETLDQLMRLELRLTKIFDQSGVRMLVGTDYGGGLVIPGVSLHQELFLLEQAGLKPLRILQMATLEAARFLNRDTELGKVKKGYRADLVLLRANPLDSVKNLTEIAGVVRAGQHYDAAQLEQLKANVAAKANAADEQN